MRARLSRFVAAVAAVFVLAALTAQAGWPQHAHAASSKIALTSAMITNESAYGDAATLADEQSLAGDPRDGAGGSPTTEWFTSFQAADHPASAYIDLGQSYDISDIYLYDGANSADLEVSVGSPGNWTLLLTDHLTGYQVWKAHPVNATTRYVRLTKLAPGANVNELVLYGEPAASGVEQKIAIDPTMVLNEIVFGGDAGALVDEQTLAGDPLNGSGGSPVTNWWLFGKNYPAPHQDESWWIPAHAFIDLGAKYHITKVYYYDGTGSGTDAFEVSTGEPFDWQVEFADSLNGYNAWKSQEINTDTRYIRYTFNRAGAKVNEIVLYGWPLEAPEPPPTPVPHTVTTTMDEFIGINAFIDDPYDKIAVAGSQREYHIWSWDDGDVDPNYPPYPNNLKHWNPSLGASLGKTWNFDQYYADLQNLNVSVAPVIQLTPAWLKSEDYDTPMTVPTGMDATDPATYIAHADHFYQYAARYGSTVVADGNLKLAPDQPRVSGLGMLDYIENWNEENGDWHLTRKEYFSPYEFAAMTSADYDGHMGTLGNTVGVKNADPNMKFLLGGLAGYYDNFPYLRAMKVWADYNRNGDFPADILNFHHYCQNEAKTVGISPEACQFKERTEEIVQYRDRYLPGKEIWISEFGYDTHPGSHQAAPAIGSKSNEQVQAEWLIRSYLALAAAGVDKAQMYMLRDSNPSEPWVYSSSGLVGTKGDWTPKISWYYVYTMKNRLKGLRFNSEVASGNANVMIYNFKDENEQIAAYALWSPTSDDTHVNQYELAIPGSPSTVSLVTMAEGDTDGIAAPLTVQNGTVKVDVSERPVFVMVDREMNDADPLWPAGAALTKSGETPTGLTLTWTPAQDDKQVMTYNIYQNDVQIGSVYRDTLTFDVVGLDPEAEAPYVFRVEASDEAGHATTGGPTVASADSAGPTWSGETALHLTDITSAGLTLEWSDTAADSGGVTQYRVMVDDAIAATVTAPARTYSLGSLSSGIIYKLAVQAGDADGNWSTDGPIVFIEIP